MNMKTIFYKLRNTIGSGFILIVSMLSIGCAITHQRRVSPEQFVQKLGVSIVAPTRFYKWIKADYTSSAALDIQSGLLGFDYDEAGAYLVRIEHQGKETRTIWGKQLLLQDRSMRVEVFTAFILAVYALQDTKDPLDTAFDALIQIIDDKIYYERKAQLLEVLKIGLQEYEQGGASWETYKRAHFEIKNKIIRIK
jgi:hypothetical protein